MFKRFSAGELHFARFVATEYDEHCLKILIYSRAFWPSVGGQETMMEILAEEFSASGHQVKVVTQVVTELERNHDYEVIRSPTVKSYVQALRWSDVCLCASISLRGLPPMMIAWTPLVISHQALPSSPDGFSMLGELKKTVTRFSGNICCSRAVQSHIPGWSVVIPNSYRAEIFKEDNGVIKDLDIVFVGRLNSDKGVSDLVEAMGHLGQAGFRPRLSIVGDGPERSAIVTKVGELDLGRQVTFTGIKTGSELARFVARHRVMAVPSRWEPFGIVALEGIACGCAVVGTALGGLPEAIGPCGVTVPNADAPAMARALRSLLEDDSLRASYCSGAPAHLARHARPNVARSYLNVLESAAGLAATRVSQ